MQVKPIESTLDISPHSLISKFQVGMNLEYCFGDIDMYLGPKNAFCAEKANFCILKLM